MERKKSFNSSNSEVIASLLYYKKIDGVMAKKLELKNSNFENDLSSVKEELENHMETSYSNYEQWDRKKRMLIGKQKRIREKMFEFGDELDGFWVKKELHTETMEERESRISKEQLKKDVIKWMKSGSSPNFLNWRDEDDIRVAINLYQRHNINFNSCVGAEYEEVEKKEKKETKGKNNNNKGKNKKKKNIDTTPFEIQFEI